MDPVGEPILEEDSNGYLTDCDGSIVNKKGYLVDDEGNVLDKRSNTIMFDKKVLEDGDIPEVFKTGLLRSDTKSSL